MRTERSLHHNNICLAYVILDSLQYACGKEFEDVILFEVMKMVLNDDDLQTMDTTSAGTCTYHDGDYDYQTEHFILRLNARSEGSEGTMSCLCVPGEETTQDVTVTSWMTCAQHSIHGSIQTAIKDEVSITSARSDSAVSGVVSRIVLCAPTPYHNQRVELRLCRQRVRHHKEKLVWNNTSVRLTIVGKVTV